MFKEFWCPENMDKPLSVQYFSLDCPEITKASTDLPYLILWDKISQNLAHLEANPHKVLQTSQNFQTILQHILWRNKHKSHFVVFITSFLQLLTILEELQSDFCECLSEFYPISLKICLISQILVHSLWHICVDGFFVIKNNEKYTTNVTSKLQNHTWFSESLPAAFLFLTSI